MVSVTSIRPQVFLGSHAPNFKANSSCGSIELYSYIKDKWCLFFSHPSDFTPVCTTELGAFAALEEEFELRDCKILGLSTNSKESHTRWIQDIKNITGFTVHFPIVCDQDRRISTIYGMIDMRNFDLKGKPVPIRSVYIIDPKKEVRLIQAYPLSTGRNTAEILRCLDSLQTVDAYHRAIFTPVNWVPGDDVIISPDDDNAMIDGGDSNGDATDDDDADKRGSLQAKFPKYRVVNEYLKLSPLEWDG